MSDRLRQIEKLFHDALAQPAAARDGFLIDACGGDDTLRREVNELLAVTTEADDLFERPLAASADVELGAGSRLGPYEIEALIGAGGMGEVYRARDTRLRRTVALKLLPRRLRLHPERQARFEREARAVAGLNHPNICALHDLGHDGRLDFLVMEYVDGETVADSLRRGPLPVDTTIRIGAAVASALAVAHAKGLIHRDVKPSNIIITREGVPKLVDFGVAMTAAGSETPTETAESRVTRTGVFVGTPQYMSPEQVVGQRLDSRTDIFSLGVVLFECLTATRPFDGDTQSMYLRNLLSAPPRSLRALRTDVPPALERLVVRCLEKDQAARQLSAVELATELTQVSSGPHLPDVRRPRVQRRTWLAASLVAGMAVTSWWAIHEWRGSSLPNDTPELRPVVQWPGREWNSRISPDGTWVSFLADRGGQTRLWIKHLDGDDDARSVATPPGELIGHTWSPDNREIAFVVLANDGTMLLHIASALTPGGPRLSAPIPDRRRWNPVAWVESTIFLTEEGAARRLLAFDQQTNTFQDVTSRWPTKPAAIDVRPDGHAVVYYDGAQDRTSIWTANVDGTGAARVTADEFNNRAPLWAGLHAIVFASDRGGQRNLWRADVPGGTARQITFSAETKTPEAASLDGSIVTFQQESVTADLWELDPRAGAEHQLTLDGRSYFWPSAAASRVIAAQVVKPQYRSGQNRWIDTDIAFAIHDESGSFQPLAERESNAFAPRLSADGKWVAYLQSSPNGQAYPQLFVTALGSGVQTKAEERFAVPGYRTNPPFDLQGSAMTWSPNQPDLYFVAQTDSGPRIRRFHAGSGTESDLVAGSFDAKDVVLNLALSPDATKLGYDRWTGSRAEVHVLDLTSHEDRVLWSDTSSSRSALALKGWRANGSALIAVRSTVNKDQTLRAELLQIDLTGRTAGPFLISPRCYSSGGRLATAAEQLYLTTVDGGIDNISAFSVSQHRLRPMTKNTLPGITFSGLEVEPDGRLLYSRQETKQDIWAIRFPR